MTDDEALYAQAVALVRAHRRASTSFIQLQLRLGYNTALRLVERMEREGIIVSPDDPPPAVAARQATSRAD